jgi:hypothetical protein
MRLLLAATAVALVLAACNQTREAAAPSGPLASAATPAATVLSGGSGCAAEVARYRAVMANDLEMGHVARRVHDRVAREIDISAATCASGREAEALSQLAATKARSGYR